MMRAVASLVLVLAFLVPATVAPAGPPPIMIATANYVAAGVGVNVLGLKAGPPTLINQFEPFLPADPPAPIEFVVAQDTRAITVSVDEDRVSERVGLGACLVGPGVLQCDPVELRSINFVAVSSGEFGLYPAGTIVKVYVYSVSIVVPQSTPAFGTTGTVRVSFYPYIPQ